MKSRRKSRDQDGGVWGLLLETGGAINARINDASLPRNGQRFQPFWVYPSNQDISLATAAFGFSLSPSEAGSEGEAGQFKAL